MSKGHTLIELVSVMAIFVLLILSSVWAYERLWEIRLALFTHEVEQFLYFAKSEALRSQAPVHVCVIQDKLVARREKTDHTLFEITLPKPITMFADDIFFQPTGKIRHNRTVPLIARDKTHYLILNTSGRFYFRQYIE